MIIVFIIGFKFAGTNLKKKLGFQKRRKQKIAAAGSKALDFARKIHYIC